MVGIVAHPSAMFGEIGFRITRLFARLHELPIADPHDGWCGRGELNALLDLISHTPTTQLLKMK